MSDHTLYGVTITIGTVTIAPKPVLTLAWHVGPILCKGEKAMPLEVSMTTEEHWSVDYPEDTRGDPATIDGQAQWTIDGRVRSRH